MAIIQNLTAITFGRSTSFGRTTGVGPYTYSVALGGAGGAIDSNGTYTAPNAEGIDTIIIRDSLNTTEQSTIKVLGPVELVLDIIQTEMGLSQGRVILWNQKIELPKDDDLFIAVSQQTVKLFSNTNEFVGTNFIQSVNVMSTLSVDLLSRNLSAKNRKEELIMALNSQYAQNQQSANGFHIGRVPAQFNNVSNEDGASMLYRYNISINIQYAVTKTKAAKFFDSFEHEVITNN